MYFINRDYDAVKNKFTEPKYTNFSTRILPHLVNTPHNIRIWSALLSAAGIRGHIENNEYFAEKKEDREFVKRAKAYFQLGPHPEINPTEPSEEDYAWWSPAEPLKISINKIIMEIYEKDSPNIKADEFMTASVLHEFVHFLDYHHDGKLQDKLTPMGQPQAQDDRGNEFEIKVYGRKAEFWRPIKPIRPRK